MRDFGINKGLVQEFETSDKRAKGAYYGWRKHFWTYLKKLKVPFADDCCDDANEANSAPVRFNTSTSKLQYYNETTNLWVDVPNASLNPV
jgi:hypothetical protein